MKSEDWKSLLATRSLSRDGEVIPPESCCVILVVGSRCLTAGPTSKITFNDTFLFEHGFTPGNGYPIETIGRWEDITAIHIQHLSR